MTSFFLPRNTKIWWWSIATGRPVRLSDLGRVIDGNEDVRNLGIVNGNPMVQIQINRQPNANIVDTVARIKALVLV